ncbi:SDR family oxidoreductase [Vibrio sp. T187]|uniref:SDR family NAD(P)-dependent oxidoreductase n=1 Tax=Vibrio TaxID=662 RepID=UPI0010CA0B16|nr:MULTISPECIES: SDR family oxidoreductase [Vibrio]MBW3698251.1 SDR family oxidoreductase [Vibrio sp. T187]
MNNSNIALITGASSGIGLELAKIHAQKGGDLVLVARTTSKLESLKAELEEQYSVAVHVLSEDLADPASPQRIFDYTESNNLTINTLINNAGFGGHGLFNERKLEADLSMIQVNISALVSLTHLYLQGMVERKQGRVLNVSSTASFLPGPLQAVYYATKSFVTSFSQAIANELESSNVTVTALCPGAVNTGFVGASGLEKVDVWKNAKTPESVALVGYQAMEKGQLVVFNEKGLRVLLEWITPLLPRKVVLKLSRQAMEKQ